MNKVERAKMIVAMEFIARQINDEDVFDRWLMCGVADGDIDYGNFNLGNSGEEFGSLFGNKSRRKHDNKNYEI